jgi:hypothetical protein
MSDFEKKPYTLLPRLTPESECLQMHGQGKWRRQPSPLLLSLSRTSQNVLCAPARREKTTCMPAQSKRFRGAHSHCGASEVFAQQMCQNQAFRSFGFDIRVAGSRPDRCKRRLCFTSLRAVSHVSALQPLSNHREVLPISAAFPMRYPHNRMRGWAASVQKPG